MRLFIAEDVLTSWTPGVAVVAAETEADIREVLIDCGQFPIDTIDEDLMQGTWQDRGEVDGFPRVITFCYGGD